MDKLEFEWDIEGIPCYVELIGVTPEEPETGPVFNRQSGDLVDPGTPHVPAEYEYRILDVAGEYADHLNEMVTPAIDREIVDHIEELLRERSEPDY